MIKNSDRSNGNKANLNACMEINPTNVLYVRNLTFVEIMSRTFIKNTNSFSTVTDILCTLSGQKHFSTASDL